MSETQNVWINQLKKGNELAAYNLYNSYSKAMYNTLIRITGDEEVAKDLLQEAFVKVFRKIQDLQDPNAFAGWAKRIVVNTGVEFLRKKKPVFETLTEKEESVSDEIEDNTDISPEALHQSIQELPDGCRTILSLHLFEGLKHNEIADKLNISLSTSKTQYRHAKILLKKKLESNYAN